MNTLSTATLDTNATAAADTPTLLAKVVGAVHAAGARLRDLYSPDARPLNQSELLSAVRRNEETSRSGLRAALETAHP